MIRLTDWVRATMRLNTRTSARIWASVGAPGEAPELTVAGPLGSEVVEAAAVDGGSAAATVPPICPATGSTAWGRARRRAAETDRFGADAAALFVVAAAVLAVDSLVRSDELEPHPASVRITIAAATEPAVDTRPQIA